MPKLHSRDLLLFSSALAIAGAAQAAEPAPEADAPAIEQVVVTAERRATDLQKTAIAISAFSQHLLAEGRDGDGGLLKVGGATLGGDHHLLDGRGGVGVGIDWRGRRRGLGDARQR